VPSPRFDSINHFDPITSAASRGGLTPNSAPPNTIKKGSGSVSCHGLDNILPPSQISIVLLLPQKCLLSPARGPYTYGTFYISRKRALYLLWKRPTSSLYTSRKERECLPLAKRGSASLLKERECLHAGPSGLPCYRPLDVGPNIPVSVLQCVAVGVFPVSREGKRCGGSSHQNKTKSKNTGISMTGQRTVYMRMYFCFCRVYCV